MRRALAAGVEEDDVDGARDGAALAKLLEQAWRAQAQLLQRVEALRQIAERARARSNRDGAHSCDSRRADRVERASARARTCCAIAAPR
jgi:hypothetical protein